MFVTYKDGEAKKAQEFIKKIRKDGFNDITVEYFVFDDKGMEITFRAWKGHSSREERSLIVNTEKVEYCYNLQKIIMRLIMEDEIVNFISKNHYIEYYSHNLDTMKSRDTDTNFFTDSVYVYQLNSKGQRTTRIQHDEICFGEHGTITFK